jgi:hypothetical protein
MTDLATLEDYELRFGQTCKASGRGSETLMHFPCPFCAAPDWYVVPTFEFGREEMDAHYCVECGRSARFLFSSDARGTRVAELVQCSGSPAPEWMPSSPRREDDQVVIESEGRLTTPAKTNARLRTRAKRLGPPPKKGKLKRSPPKPKT